jgi:hypothetical protein
MANIIVVHWKSSTKIIAALCGVAVAWSGSLTEKQLEGDFVLSKLHFVACSSRTSCREIGNAMLHCRYMFGDRYLTIVA